MSNNSLLNLKNSDKSNYSILATSAFDYRKIAPQDKLNFNFNITYNGSNSIQFIPIGKRTDVQIDSDWKSLSFEGSFAASDTTKTVNHTGSMPIGKY